MFAGASSLRKTYLNRVYAQTINGMKAIMLTVTFPQTITLVFDGWTNIHYESVWVFIALLPIGSIILRTVNASADSHSADFIAGEVEALFQDFDPLQFGAIVSDNGGGCENACKLVVSKHKHMIEKRCMMHGYALVMGSVFGFPWARSILKLCQSLVSSVKSSHKLTNWLRDEIRLLKASNVPLQAAYMVGTGCNN